LNRPRLAGFQLTGDKIDNNLVENAIRPTAIGKKNWLFVGEADAGERSAILYTIIESCRRRAIDPYAYLRDVLSRLPHMTNWQIPEVIPSTWGKALCSHNDNYHNSLRVYDSCQNPLLLVNRRYA